MKPLLRLLCPWLLTFAPAPGGQGVITPRVPIELFNGRDLTNFYTWNRDHGREDPDRVFTVVDRIDGAPAIRISGQRWGGLVTRDAFADYRIVVEFRWGVGTWEPRHDKTRDSGLLLHCQGEDGNTGADFRGAWMRSVECQIIEGGTGDLILVGGYERGHAEPLLATLHTTITSGTRRYTPGGEPVLLTKGRHRTDWVHKAPDWTDRIGFRGPRDVERPVGEWNRLEAVCAGGDVTFLLNGVTVNAGRDGSLRSGRILLQSEGAELYVRKVELHPLARP